jgi:hypothetical protein
MTGGDQINQRDRVIIANGWVVSPWRVLNPGTVIVEGDRIVEIREGLGSDEEGATFLALAVRIAGSLGMVHGVLGCRAWHFRPG